MGLLVLIAALALWTPDLDWATLERAYLRDRHDLRVVDGVRWHVRDEGQAEDGTLVLVHGFASDLQTWNVWADSLRSRYRVVRMDLPGFALSGPVAGGDYGLHRQCQRLDALLTEMQVGAPSRSGFVGESAVKPVIWVGHSMGADLVAQCATQSDRPPQGLVLIAPPRLVSETSRTWTTTHANGDEGAQSLQWMAWFAWALPRRWVHQGLSLAHAVQNPPSEAEVDRSFAMLRAPGVRSAILQMGAQRRTDFAVANARASFQGPVWVAVGDQERLLNFGSLGELAPRVNRRWPQARLQMYPNAGHMVHEDAATALTEDVRRFAAQITVSFKARPASLN